MSPRIAFFDLDKTLISTNSARGWIEREVRLGFLSRTQALRGMWWLGLYHLGLGKMEDTVRAAVAALEGAREEDLRERTRAFWTEEVRPLIRDDARAALQAHKDAGDLVVLLTSSSDYMSECVADELGLDGFLCNRFEVRDGRFTGATIEPLCFGEGKAIHARAYANERGIDLADCAFYTDSVSDLAALLVMGEPVAVTPDPRLRREATRRGWPIAEWS